MPTTGKRLSIYLGESDSWRGRSLYMSILETLRRSGIAGATVTRGVAGFGAHSRIHTDAIERLSMDLPVLITVVDSPENIERAVLLVKPMVREGLITVEPVEIVKYVHRYLQPLPADRPVSTVMTANVVAVSPETPAVRVIELLLGQLFKAVPVIDAERRVVGIITDDDLVRRASMPARLAVGERLQAESLRGFLAQVRTDRSARDIMTSPVQTVQVDDALGPAVQRMLELKRKRMPVVDAQGRLAGILSRADVLRAIAEEGHAQHGEPGKNLARSQEQAPPLKPGRTIGELMLPVKPTVHVDDDLIDVLQSLLDADAKRVVVLDDQGKAAGIITDGDLVARVSPTVQHNVLQTLIARVTRPDINRGSATARSLMSEQVLSASAETTIVEAISRMLREERKRIVVVDPQGYPIGIVDRQTLMAASLGDTITGAG